MTIVVPFHTYTAILYILELRLTGIVLHCEKRFVIFPSPAGMSLTKLSLDGNSLIIPVQGEFGQCRDIPAGNRKSVIFFYSV